MTNLMALILNPIKVLSILAHYLQQIEPCQLQQQQQQQQQQNNKITASSLFYYPKRNMKKKMFRQWNWLVMCERLMQSNKFA